MDPAGMSDPVTLTLFGAGAHYAQGVAFALIYAFGIHPLLPIANTVLGNFAKAIIWGLILGTLSAVWWINLFPNLAGPGVNAGIFMSNFGPDQLKWVVAVYLWHIVYGFNLGAFYQPRGHAGDRGGLTDRPTPNHVEAVLAGRLDLVERARLGDLGQDFRLVAGHAGHGPAEESERGRHLRLADRQGR